MGLYKSTGRVRALYWRGNCRVSKWPAVLTGLNVSGIEGHQSVVVRSRRYRAIEVSVGRKKTCKAEFSLFLTFVDVLDMDRAMLPLFLYQPFSSIDPNNNLGIETSLKLISLSSKFDS